MRLTAICFCCVCRLGRGQLHACGCQNCRGAAAALEGVQQCSQELLTLLLLRWLLLPTAAAATSPAASNEAATGVPLPASPFFQCPSRAVGKIQGLVTPPANAGCHAAAPPAPQLLPCCRFRPACQRLGWPKHPGQPSPVLWRLAGRHPQAERVHLKADSCCGSKEAHRLHLNVSTPKASCS